jgi:hypothetical protein
VEFCKKMALERACARRVRVPIRVMRTPAIERGRRVVGDAAKRSS